MTTEAIIQPSKVEESVTANDATATRKLVNHPSYESMITAAIFNLKERKGSSRPAIKKYILANYKVNPGNQFDYQVSNAIRRGVGKNIFSLPKGSSGTIKLVKPAKKETMKRTANPSKKKGVNNKKVANKTGDAARLTTSAKPAIRKSRMADILSKKKADVPPAEKASKKKEAATPTTPRERVSGITACL